MPVELVPLLPDQIESLTGLCAVGLPLDSFTPELLHHRIFDDPRYDPDLSLALTEAGRLVGVAVGVLRSPEPPALHGWLKLFVIAPGCRRRGLGTQLLEEMETRFRQRGAVRMDTVGFPRYFWPGVDVRYTPACCLLEWSGFREHRTLVNMTVDLTAGDFDTADREASLADDDFRFERVDEQTLDPLLDTVGAEWPPWRDEIRIAAANGPISLFAATHRGRPVAFAAYDTAGFPGTFGPMGTLPEMRSRGLGEILLKKCLGDMKAQGRRQAEIAWVGPVGFYARQVDATISRVFRDYRKDLAD